MILNYDDDTFTGIVFLFLGKPVIVYIDIFIMSISSIDDFNMVSTLACNSGCINEYGKKVCVKG